MIDSLISITESGEFEDSGEIFLQKFERSPSELLLHLKINLGTDFKSQLWIIKCINPIKFQVDDEFVGNLELITEHVLLWPLQKLETDLFFYSAAANPSQIVGALYEQHMKITGGWFSFNQFTNGEIALTKLLSSNSGKIARGPVPLLQAYQEVLNDFKIKNSILEPRPSKRWENGMWVENTTPFQLLLLGKSYVIAENIAAAPAP